MNGRMYDPLTARFLSPDILVQNPEFTQSYNRYTYALNNPLKYTDPSGYKIGILAQTASGLMDDYPDLNRWGGGGSSPSNDWWESMKMRHQAFVIGSLIDSDPIYGWTYDWNTGVVVNRYTGDIAGAGSFSRYLAENSPYTVSGNRAKYIVGNILKNYNRRNYFFDYSGQDKWDSYLIASGGDGDHNKGLRLVPVAITYGVDLDVISGYGSDMNPISVGIILRGDDQWEIFTLHDAGSGIGFDISGSIEATRWYYSGNIDNFTIQTINGLRTEFNFGYSGGIDAGAGFIISPPDRYGGRLWGIRGYFGLGFPSGVSGNVNRGRTFIHSRYR
jgi:hypothetical protein